MTLRPRSCGARVLLPRLPVGTAVRGRAGSGPKAQRLLQTPDWAVLLISYLLKNAPTVGVLVCVFPFRGSFSSKLPFTDLAKRDWLTEIGKLPFFCFPKEATRRLPSALCSQRGVMGGVWGSPLAPWPQTSLSLAGACMPLSRVSPCFPGCRAHRWLGTGSWEPSKASEQELCTHLKCLLGLLVMPQLCSS